MAGLRIIGAGFALPRRVVTNDDLGKVIDTSDDWIYSRTGIHERRIIGEGEAAHTLAVSATERAIDAAERSDPDFSRGKIGAVIVGTMTSDYVFPSVACVLQKELALPESVRAFDISAACTGFVYSMQAAFGMLSEGEYALVVGTECMSKVLNFKDRSTCVLFGDGAGAVVVRRDSSDKSLFIEVSGTEGDTENLYCKLSRDGIYDEAADGFLHMNGGTVFKFATHSLEKAIYGLLKSGGFTMDDIDMVICHQANARIINHVKKKFANHENKFFMNLENFANTSAASVAIALADAYGQGLIKAGNKIILASFGAGLSWNGILMTV